MRLKLVLRTGRQVLGIGNILLNSSVDLIDGGGLGQLGGTSLQGLEPSGPRAAQRECSGRGGTREKSKLALESMSGRAEVDAEGTVETGHAEVGSDVRKKSNAGLLEARHAWWWESFVSSPRACRGT